MIDETFQESYKQSHDKKFLCRLFRIQSDDGSIRMSIEVMLHTGGHVFYQLPKEYWLGTTELLDWDDELDILFFTTNGKTKAFIYDVTYLTLVEKDIDLPPKDFLYWNSEKKEWLARHYLFSVKAEDMEPENPMSVQYKPGNYYETLNVLKLPYDEDNSPKYIIEDSNSERFKVILRKTGKIHKISPTMWEIGVIDIENFTWVVERLPYIVKEDGIDQSHDHKVECYGFDKKMEHVYLFRYFLDKILEDNKLNIFINDFEPHRPANVVWDSGDSCWRAVIKGEVISPRPFYFDNMYSMCLPVEGKPLPIEVLEALPANEVLKERIAELKIRRKKEMEEKYAQDNTSADEIFKRMRKANRNLGERHMISVPTGRGNQHKKRAGSGDFLTSKWFIVLISLLLLGATIGMIAYTASGNPLPPVAARNLFTAIATLFMLDTGLIVSNVSKKKEILQLHPPQSPTNDDGLYFAVRPDCHPHRTVLRHG